MHFLNSDISIVIKVTIMKIAIHVAEIHWEGRVSQNVDIGHSLYFILCRRVDFQKVTKKYKSCPFFAIK